MIFEPSALIYQSNRPTTPPSATSQEYAGMPPSPLRAFTLNAEKKEIAFRKRRELLNRDRVSEVRCLHRIHWRNVYLRDFFQAQSLARQASATETLRDQTLKPAVLGFVRG